MKLTILNNNTMKKIIFLIMISFISLKSMAGDGDKFFNISGGWQWKNTGCELSLLLAGAASACHQTECCNG